ncbi:MAG: radical SAM family heme chaperone HemW [Candidatus Caldatribacteriaceae bacterium]
MSTLSVYVHFPFCVKRCRYCDFISYPWGGRSEYLAYLVLLQEELFLKVRTYALWGRQIETIYFGGGTPSLLGAEDLAGFLKNLKAVFVLPPQTEVTLELRPREAEILKVESFRKIGINRLSIGIQSFEPRNLYLLGRDTPVAALVETIEKAREFYANWNIDLLYSLPLQDLGAWQKDLEKALSFEPPHLSVYNLTLHPSVPLYWFWASHPRFFPSKEVEGILWEWTVTRLKGEGYRHYEISNFAKPGHECQHNLAYWSNREYLGLGVSAWSYLKETRERNTASLQSYFGKLKGGHLPISFRETLSPSRRVGEIIALGLRKEEGISIEELDGYPPGVVEEKIKTLSRLAEEGWLVEQEGRFSFSPRGWLLANQVLAEIID